MKVRRPTLVGPARVGVTIVVTALARGALFMVAVDVVHTYWLPALPTIGYAWAVFVSNVMAFVLKP